MINRSRATKFLDYPVTTSFENPRVIERQDWMLCFFVKPLPIAYVQYSDKEPIKHPPGNI